MKIASNTIAAFFFQILCDQESGAFNAEIVTCQKYCVHFAMFCL